MVTIQNLAAVVRECLPSGEFRYITRAPSEGRAYVGLFILGLCCGVHAAAQPVQPNNDPMIVQSFMTTRVDRTR